MALEIGSETANVGMSAAIYSEMDRLLAPPLQAAVDGAETDDVRAAAQTALDEARKGWQKLAYAVANGVVSHLQSNLEVRDAADPMSAATPVRDVDGTTGSAPPSNHTHGAGSLSVTLDDLIFR